MSNSLLQLQGLTVTFQTPQGDFPAVRSLSLEINKHEVVGVVGESGSGKSQTFLAALGLLAKNGSTTGQVLFDGISLLEQPPKAQKKWLGSRIGMVFQDPMTALNPYRTVGSQMLEVLKIHAALPAKQAYQRALELLDSVKISDPERCMRLYPFELSGGMQQRVIIATALLCNPDILIADEPTTALDVTIQAEILELLHREQAKRNFAIVLITHDLGVVAGFCHRLIVMYAGRIVEEGPVKDVLTNPQHPYTQALLASVPRPKMTLEELVPIPGTPPAPFDYPAGCAFAPRCPYAFKLCAERSPDLLPVRSNWSRACFLNATEV